jgi:MscS family membrane protein
MRMRAPLLAWPLLLACALPAGAQEAPGPPPPAAAAPDDTSQLTPRSTIRGFLTAARNEDWTRAAEHMNLMNLPLRRRESAGRELARRLKTVLDRTVLIDPESLSAAPEGNENDGQPEGRDLVGTIETGEGPVKLYVERMRGADDALEWRFSRPTVDKIERLYEEFGHEPPFADRLPPFFFSVRVLDTALWQWIGLAVVLLGAVAASLLVTFLLLAVARLVVRYTRGDVDNAIVEMAVGPLRLILAVAFARLALPALWLPIAVHRVVIGLAAAVWAIALTWFAVRLVTVFSRLIQIRMAARGNAVGISAIPLVRRVVNIVIVLLAVLVVVSNLGVNMTGVLAGVGVGGLAVALAAQKTLENLFGGITLIMDQPVRIGDFCRFGTREGTVEDIGLRSTRIRTLERTLVTIPNAEFSTMQIENLARRDRMILVARIGIRYDASPDQLRWLLIELKKMLLAHPKVDPDPARVRFVGFGGVSLDLDVFAYLRTADYNEYQAIREDVLLRIMEIVTASGTSFSAPASPPVDPDKARAAEATVRRWRDEGVLYLPDVPGEAAAGLADTLDYPPRGSAAAG